MKSPKGKRVLNCSTPATVGPWIRDDGGAETGSEVTVFYDPLISKLSAWGTTRPEAIARMRRALAEYFPTTGEGDYRDWFPSIHFKYNFTRALVGWLPGGLAVASVITASPIAVRLPRGPSGKSCPRAATFICSPRSSTVGAMTTRSTSCAR